MQRRARRFYTATQPHRVPAFTLLLLFAFAGGPAALRATSTAAPEPKATASQPLHDRHRAFLDEVDLLISDSEREVFLGLSEDYRRDAFVREFWRVRDPYPETGRNEFRAAWEQQHNVAADRFENRDDDRYRLMAAHGEPRRVTRVSCELLRPLELWHYSARGRLPEFWAVLSRSAGSYRLWSPTTGLNSISQGHLPLDQAQAADQIATVCSRGDEIITALALSPDWENGGLTDHLPKASAEWALAFRNRSLEVDADSAAHEIEPEVRYVGRHQSRTVVALRLQVPRDAIPNVTEAANDAATDAATPPAMLKLLLDGEVVRGEDLFETFRYRFDLPVAATEEGPIPVVIERLLRPGRYEIRLRLVDRVDDHTFVARAPLDVPRWTPANGEADSGGASSSIDRGATIAPVRVVGDRASVQEADSEETQIRLRVPRDELLTGRVRVQAISRGTDIARVGFELDGRQLMTKARPPYDVEIDIGRAPRRRQLRAFALDATGVELATDEVTLNAGPNSFSVRLIEPQRNEEIGESVRAVAEVEVPRLEQLDRVEFFLNEERLATLYQPPFAQSLQVPQDTPLSFVRVVAHLRGGGAAEDMVFLNAPDEVEYLDVNFVQLFVSVTDRRGRPILDLEPHEITVREDGERLQLRRFEAVEDLPIHACILLDTSTSMEDRLEEASNAALYFFEKVLGVQDRACLVTFNDLHELVVPFTSSMEVLSGGLTGLEADGETALFDSLIHTLFYFGGIRGKRALVLLSDGEDSSSEYDYAETLEFAQRSGVAIYAIGLAIDQRAMDVRSKLNRLARETGGRSYFIEEASELRRLYEKIEEEIRAQYLVAYQSPGTSDEFREIEVEVGRKGVKARTLRGYYPH